VAGCTAFCNDTGPPSEQNPLPVGRKRREITKAGFPRDLTVSRPVGITDRDMALVGLAVLADEDDPFAVVGEIGMAPIVTRRILDKPEFPRLEVEIGEGARFRLVAIGADDALAVRREALVLQFYGRFGDAAGNE